MGAGLKALLCGFLVMIASAAHSQPAEMSPETYLNDALKVLETRHVNRAEADWAALKAEARNRARGAKTIGDTYPAIEYVIDALGEKHTIFYPPPPPRAASSASAAPRPRPAFRMPEPSGELVDGRYGYIRIPTFGAPADHPDADLFTAMTRRILLNHDRAGVCGWIVDVRGNTGGNIWPMLDGLLPLLSPRISDGAFGAFDIDGQVSPITVKGGRLIGSGIPDRPVFETRMASRAHAPIAILVDGKTASAGEGVANAFRGLADVRYFGETSADLVTVNDSISLADGASMQLTIGYSLDRAGKRIAGPVQPDENMSSEAAKEAAVNWLSSQTCPA